MNPVQASLGIIRSLSLIVPFGLRAEWRAEWEAEIRRHSGSSVDLIFRSFGAVFDALWLRRNEWSFDMLFEDLSYAVRTLLQRPSFTSVVILILALGIGANTAVFSVLDAVLLKPLPYPDPERIVTIWDTNQEQGRNHEGPSPANLEDWRRQSVSFEGITSWYSGKPVTLQSAQDAEKIVAAEVTEGFFEVFGRRPIFGRAFDAREYKTQERVVVLSHGVWQSRFGGNEAIIGSHITLDGNPHTVVGIMPPDFSIPNKEAGIWRPWNFGIGYASRRGGVPRDARFLRVAGRLTDGVTVEEAQNEMDRIVATLSTEYPAVNRGWGVRLIPLHEEFAGSLRPILLVLLGAVGFVLLIACTNI